ncbi:MAG: methylmalonyl Co-A mutase-associated GTPase MeaB [Thermoplasmata archaeon]|nr:methylmalonyl Co-A mutase-associated GTPase MeaB [Thermoplasmata archaeon]
MTRRGSVPATPGARAVLNGDRRALARLITRVEGRDPSVVPTLRSLYPRTGRARVVGLTGPLGVGKSSLINALLQHLRAEGHQVAVVAVDPTSPFSGGSVLGDRIRLDRRADDTGVFIRSMASRGHSGGVAAATREVVRLLDAAGFDVVLVETVGSGQVDVEIRDIASTSIVVLVPHLGDEVQTLKAGLFEIADVFCVNKGDLPGAESASRDLLELAGLGPGREGWRPKVVTTSARDGTGIAPLWAAVNAHETYLDSDGRRAAGERRRLGHELVELVRERVARDLEERLDSDVEVGTLLDQLATRAIDPYVAAERLFATLRADPTGPKE